MYGLFRGKLFQRSFQALRFVEVLKILVSGSKRSKFRRISLRHDSKGDFGTVLVGKRKNAMRRKNYLYLYIYIYICMFKLCKKRTPKEYSRLQSCKEFPGFRANVSSLETCINNILIYIYTYTYIYIHIYTYIYIFHQ